MTESPAPQPLPDLQFHPPESTVVSVRVNRDELRTLTMAARFHGLKLSTYIKSCALQRAREPQLRITKTEGFGNDE